MFIKTKFCFALIFSLRFIAKHNGRGDERWAERGLCEHVGPLEEREPTRG